MALETFEALAKVRPIWNKKPHGPCVWVRATAGAGAGQLPPRAYSAETNERMEASSRWRRVPGPRPGHGLRTRIQTEQECWERRGPRGAQNQCPRRARSSPVPLRRTAQLSTRHSLSKRAGAHGAVFHRAGSLKGSESLVVMCSQPHGPAFCCSQRRGAP